MVNGRVLKRSEWRNEKCAILVYGQQLLYGVRGVLKVGPNLQILFRRPNVKGAGGAGSLVKVRGLAGGRRRDSAGGGTRSTVGLGRGEKVGGPLVRTLSRQAGRVEGWARPWLGRFQNILVPSFFLALHSASPGIQKWQLHGLFRKS